MKIQLPEQLRINGQIPTFLAKKAKLRGGWSKICLKHKVNNNLGEFDPKR